MAKKSMMMMKNGHYINVALLFAWILIYGLFGGSGMMDMVMLSLFAEGNLLTLLIYLSPLLAMHLGGKRSSWLYFAPLLWNALIYADLSYDAGYSWYFWVSLVISFYASIKIAENGDKM